MISSLILSCLEFLPHLRFFGVTSLVFNRHQMIFSHEPEVQKKVLRNFFLHLLWLALSGLNLVGLYRRGNVVRVNQDIPFWLLMAMTGAGYGIHAFFPTELRRIANGITDLFPHLQRK